MDGLVNVLPDAMNGFFGYSNHVIDGKFRLALPSKFREGLKQPFVITKNFEEHEIERCILVFSLEGWQTIMEKANTELTMDAISRRFRRDFFGSTEIVEPDAQGRVLVPEHLRKHAGITKDVLSLGAGDHVELWAKERYDAYKEQADSVIKQQMSKIMSKVGL
jgi:MraZ protein